MNADLSFLESTNVYLIIITSVASEPKTTLLLNDCLNL